MDIYLRLSQDHDKQRELCEKIMDTDGATETRASLWRQLSAELDAHASAEEQVFYAALIKKPDATDAARHSIHEHQEMTKLIQGLDESDQGSGGWMNKFKKLKHQILHHLKEEEKEIFAKAKELIDSEQAKEMLTSFNTRKSAELENT